MIHNQSRSLNTPLSPQVLTILITNKHLSSPQRPSRGGGNIENFIYQSQYHAVCSMMRRNATRSTPPPTSPEASSTIILRSSVASRTWRSISSSMATQRQSAESCQCQTASWGVADGGHTSKSWQAACSLAWVMKPSKTSVPLDRLRAAKTARISSMGSRPLSSPWPAWNVCPN